MTLGTALFIFGAVMIFSIMLGIAVSNEAKAEQDFDNNAAQYLKTVDFSRRVRVNADDLLNDDPTERSPK